MSTTIETPSDAPVAEPSLDQIVAEELKAADATGAAVVTEDQPATQGASEADGAHTADPAGSTPASATEETTPADSEPADDVTAARVRKMLAKLDEREAAVAAREAASTGDTLAELLKNPKAWLAKHGKSIDDVIDASIAEGKTAPPAEGDDNPRLTALERRIEEREAAEQSQRQQAAIDNRKAEIAREIKASPKFPLINEADRAGAVVDFMIEYHSIHGKPIAWDRAAALVEAVLKSTGEKIAKKMGWAAPAAKPAAPPVKDRPGTTSLSGAQSTAAATDPAEPEDPEKLMKFLVAQAGLGA